MEINDEEPNVYGVKMMMDINYFRLMGPDGIIYVLTSHLEGILNLIAFMRKVIYGTESYFTTYKTLSGVERSTISSIGKHARSLKTYGQLYSSRYTFSPLITFFFAQYCQHPIMEEVSVLSKYPSADLFDDFLCTMRKNAVATNLKKSIADWESKPKKNSLRLKQFQSELFRRHARVSVVRLDLNYHAAVFTKEEIEKIVCDSHRQRYQDCENYYASQGTPQISQASYDSTTVNVRVALEEVQGDRHRLFSSMKGKPSLFKHLVGYVWHIECGETAGYHLHVMLFFDGAYVQKHEYLANEIGEYWKNEITNGRGYFENCNRTKNKFPDTWALGQIDHWDTEKRNHLDKALHYFCKNNQVVQIIPYPGCRLFGSGFVRRRDKSNKGRRRKEVNSCVDLVVS